jgi:hypothetical protein
MSDIIQFSVPRSGSTLVTQILRDLFADKHVVKTHNFINSPGSKIVVTIRDFRDCLASNWRVLNDIPFSDLENGRVATKSELLFETERTKEFLCSLNSMNEHYQSEFLLLKYEDFVNNYGFIFDQISDYFAADISIATREVLTAKYSMHKNKARADQFTTFGKWEESGIHGLHVYKGEVGTWRHLIPKELHGILNSELAHDLKIWGYQ